MIVDLSRSQPRVFWQRMLIRLFVARSDQRILVRAQDAEGAAPDGADVQAVHVHLRVSAGGVPRRGHNDRRHFHQSQIP